jgi:Ca-activated chloride channel family protein
VLLKLEKVGQGSEVTLKASYKNRQQESFRVTENVDLAKLSPDEGDEYDNTGIRKAILLTRYTNIIKNWIYEERQERFPEPIVFDAECLDCTQPYPIPPNFSRWERASTPLSVSPRTKEALKEFKEYYQQEVEKIGDEDLQKEVEVLNKLINS